MSEHNTGHYPATCPKCNPAQTIIIDGDKDTWQQRAEQAEAKVRELEECLQANADLKFKEQVERDAENQKLQARIKDFEDKAPQVLADVVIEKHRLIKINKKLQAQVAGLRKALNKIRDICSSDTGNQEIDDLIDCNELADGALTQTETPVVCTDERHGEMIKLADKVQFCCLDMAVPGSELCDSHKKIGRKLEALTRKESDHD